MNLINQLNKKVKVRIKVLESKIRVIEHILCTDTLM